MRVSIATALKASLSTADDWVWRYGSPFTKEVRRDNFGASKSPKYWAFSVAVQADYVRYEATIYNAGSYSSTISAVCKIAYFVG